jgi:hypothetical protein
MSIHTIPIQYIACNYLAFYLDMFTYATWTSTLRKWAACLTCVSWVKPKQYIKADILSCTAVCEFICRSFNENTNRNVSEVLRVIFNSYSVGCYWFCAVSYRERTTLLKHYMQNTVNCQVKLCEPSNTFLICVQLHFFIITRSFNTYIHSSPWTQIPSYLGQWWSRVSCKTQFNF